MEVSEWFLALSRQCFHVFTSFYDYYIYLKCMV